jgi:DNA-binding response OmpR family regulator
VVTDVLGGAGFDVEVAADAFGARELLRRRHVDAVLLDIGLPGLSGLHICREIRRDPATAGLPVIMMTGDAQPEARLAGERAGATGHLIKPVQVRALIRQLRTVM